MRTLLVIAAPLALSAICMRLFDRLDIFALRLLGGSLESVAAYGVAQNLALGPGLFASAFIPALVAALSYRLARGDADGARTLGGDALRSAFLMLPLALLVAGAAPALVDLLFGPSYAAAAPLFGILIVGAVATTLIAIAGGVLIAAGLLRWTIVLTAPLLAIAIAGHIVMVPRAGAIGAAMVTATTAVAGAAAGCIAIARLVGTPIPFATLLRGLPLGAAAAVAARRWPPHTVTFLPIVAALVLMIAIGLVLSGELRADERDVLYRRTRALLRLRAAAEP